MSSYRGLRTVLALLVGLVVLAGIAVAVLVARFDPNSFKPRIEAAVANATGRTLTLGGPIRLSLFPFGITLRDVALSNPPGFGDGPMARVRQITLRLDLAPLLHRRLVVRELDIDRPEIALERNASGLANWSFAATSSAPPQPQAAPPPPNTKAVGGTEAAVLDARITDGVLTYRDARSGQAYSLAVPRLAVSAADPQAPMHLDGQASIADTTLTVTADTGRLAGFAQNEFWPLRVTARAEGGTVRGTLDLTAPSADQPMRAAAQGSVRGTPVALNASLGTPKELAGNGQPLPVQVEAQAAGAKAALNGTVARPMQMAGVNLAVSAQVPDLAALSPLAGQPLPNLHAIAASARLADLGGLGTGVALPELRVTAPPGDLAGSAEIVLTPRPTVRANLAGSRLDLAAMRAAMAPASPAPAPRSAPTAASWWRTPRRRPRGAAQ